MKTIELESVATGVRLSIGPDGECEWSRTPKSGYNSYLHFVGDVPVEGPSEPQRAMLARWFLGIARPAPDDIFGSVAGRSFKPGLGRPVCAWAFAGLDAQGVSDRYGDGGHVAMTAPTNEQERII